MTKITFKANKNTVVANQYVAHELYVRNEEIINELGGEIVRGVGGFRAEFPSAAKAKAFVEQAITSISKKEYNACRKSEPKVQAPASGKGKKAKTKEITKCKGKFITLTDDDGNTYKVDLSVLGVTPKATTTKVVKGKGKAKKEVATKKVAKGKGKGCAVDFSKIAGKGRAYNKKAAELIYKTGCKPNTAQFNALWDKWCEVR